MYISIKYINIQRTVCKQAGSSVCDVLRSCDVEEDIQLNFESKADKRFIVLI